MNDYLISADSKFSWEDYRENQWAEFDDMLAVLVGKMGVRNVESITPK